MTRSAAIAIWIAAGAIFWGLDEVLVVVLQPPTLTTVALRNLVLIVLFAGACLLRRQNDTNGQRMLCAVVFVSSLWVSGAIVDAVHQSQAGAGSYFDMAASIAIFPLTTLGAATMSGVLPALPIVSIVAVISATPSRGKGGGCVN
jgi:hypothetical protein